MTRPHDVPTRALVALGIASLLLSSCQKSGGSSSPSPTPSPTPTGLKLVSCAALIPDVIDLTKDSKEGDRIQAIYRPKPLLNRITEFNAGVFKIPPGKDKVEVVTCSGSASFDDGTDGVAIHFGEQVDVNNDTFVYFKQV